MLIKYLISWLGLRALLNTACKVDLTSEAAAIGYYLLVDLVAKSLRLRFAGCRYVMGTGKRMIAKRRLNLEMGGTTVVRDV